jgi:methylmalonyl-CoA mutase cobalamin-binding domain/chain
MTPSSSPRVPHAPRDIPIRVLLAKLGLDGHDRGAKVVMHILRDAGMDVIYTGRHAHLDTVVKTAIEEDVDLIGLSLLNNNHLSISKRLLEAMRTAGIGDIPTVVGGIIPDADDAMLKSYGIADVFHVHTPPSEIVERVRRAVEPRRRLKLG